MISVKAAFLLSLLVTTGFETGHARRINYEKLKKLKQDLGIGKTKEAKEVAVDSKEGEAQKEVKEVAADSKVEEEAEKEAEAEEMAADSKVEEEVQNEVKVGSDQTTKQTQEGVLPYLPFWESTVDYKLQGWKVEKERLDAILQEKTRNLDEARKAFGDEGRTRRAGFSTPGLEGDKKDDVETAQKKEREAEQALTKKRDAAQKKRDAAQKKYDKWANHQKEIEKAKKDEGWGRSRESS